MRPMSAVAIVTFLAALLACKGEAPDDTAQTCNYDGPGWVCRSEGDVLVYEVTAAVWRPHRPSAA